MKKKMLIFILLVLFTSTNVYAISDAYYTNLNGVELSKEEYDFLSEFYFEGYQDYMTREDYTEFYNSHIMNGNIKINTISLNNNSSSRTTNYYETNMKLLKMSSSCSTNCFIATTLTWKTNPSVRSYDHIGAYFYNTSIDGTVDSKLYNNENIIYSSYSSKTSCGIDFIYKLPTNNSSIEVVNSFYVKKSGTVNVSYQHAKKSISLKNSKKYSFSGVGYGGVYDFTNSVSSYYDAMSGLSQSF